jgi:hypothetical protein
MTSTNPKVRENRLRATAKRRGLVLTKTRTRDPLALDYGLWRLANTRGRVVFQHRHLGAVERYLDGGS